MGAAKPQEKKGVRKGHSLIQLILQLKELDLFRFKEGFILPALNSPELMQYGLRWLKSFSQRWGPGSRWNYLLASYVTPTNGSNAFFNCLKNLNFEQIGKIQFSKGLFPIISKFGSFKISKNA